MIIQESTGSVPTVPHTNTRRGRTLNAMLIGSCPTEMPMFSEIRTPRTHRTPFYETWNENHWSHPTLDLTLTKAPTLSLPSVASVLGDLGVLRDPVALSDPQQSLLFVPCQTHKIEINRSLWETPLMTANEPQKEPSMTKKKSIELPNASNSFISDDRLAAELHVSQRTIRRWVQQGHLPECTKIGRRCCWSIEDLRKFFLNIGLEAL